MRRILLVLVLASALAVAGCLSDDGDGAGTASDEATPTQDEGSADAVDGNETDDADPEPEWNRTTFSGEAPGPNLVFLFTPGPTHNVTVVDGTRNLTINASSSDGELLVDIYPPGCKEQDNVRGEGCSHTADTEDGEGGHWATDDPEPGTWTVRVSKGDYGYGSTSYEVTADRLEPAATS